MHNDYSYSFDNDLKYCYPNSSVLKNKLNINNEYDLSIAEREISSLRMMQLEKEPIKGNLDFNKYIIIFLKKFMSGPDKSERLIFLKVMYFVIMKI